MSFFSSIGKVLGGVAKTVGGAALNVAGGAIGDNHLGTDLFGGSSASSTIATAPPQYLSSYSPYSSGFGFNSGGVSSVQQSPSLIDQFKGLLLVASGNKPIQTNVSSNALPSWLLPVGLVAAVLIGVKAVSKR